MSDDSDLNSIRKKRMQELQSMQEQQDPLEYGVPKGGQESWKNQQSSQVKQEEMMEQQKAVFNSVLNQVLDQQARARLNTIMVAKPEKGRQIESMILQMAQTGQLGGKLSENDLIGLVERVNAQTQKKTTVKFDRRRAALDSDDDDW